MHIGKRIAKIRKSRGFSQHELGKGILSGSYLSHFESGKSVPSEKILGSLAEKLDVPADYLLDCDKRDEWLEKRLTEYRESIILDLELAKRSRIYIKEKYPLFRSIEQEVYFHLCECNFLIKTNELDKAMAVYDQEVTPFLNGMDVDEWTGKIKEVYYNYHGLRCFYQLCNSDSLRYYRKQLASVEQKFLRAPLLYNISLLSLKLDHIQKGIDYGQEALDIYLRENKWKEITDTYNLLGVLYYEDYNFSAAKDQLSKALEIANVYELTERKDRIYHNFGMVFAGNGDWQDSENYYSLSLTLKATSDPTEVGLTYRCLADVYLKQGKFDQAGDLLKEAFKVCPKTKHFHQLKMSEAQLHLHYGRSERYEEIMKEAIRFLYDHQQWKSLMNKITPFADFLFEQKKFQEAARFYKMEIEARERMRSERI